MFAVTQGIDVKIAQSLQVINLLGSYIIGFNVQAQAAEDIIGIPKGNIQSFAYFSIF